MWPSIRTVDSVFIFFFGFISVEFSLSSSIIKNGTENVVKMSEFPETCEPTPFTPEEERAIDELIRLFPKRPDIEFQRDNYFLTKFLRFCDWDPQKAFGMIITLYELKHANPMYYATKNVSEYMDLLNLNSRVMMDKRDKCGRAVFIAKLGEHSNHSGVHFSPTSVPKSDDFIFTASRKYWTDDAVPGCECFRWYLRWVAAMRPFDSNQWDLGYCWLQRS